MYYKTCVYCGANLDVGEKCDCQDEVRADNEHKKVALKYENWTMRLGGRYE